MRLYSPVILKIVKVQKDYSEGNVFFVFNLFLKNLRYFKIYRHIKLKSVYTIYKLFTSKLCMFTKGKNKFVE